MAVEVTTRPISRPLPRGFVGFSIEYSSSVAYAGSDPRAPNPTYIRLIRALNPAGSTVLRFGGDTTDWTWWPTPEAPRPPGVRFALTRRWLAVTRAAARAMGAHLILGVNFEADSRAVAAAEARALLRGLGHGVVAGLELGNEPEAYGNLGWYRTPAGIGVPGRAASYSFSDYVPDYATIRAALPRNVPLVGPASGAPAWSNGLAQYLATNPGVGLVTFHRYALLRCFTTPGYPAPSIPRLLSTDASSGPSAGLRPAVEVAHAHRLPIRLDELNSVSCGGAPGVSNTFASALWVIDTLFHAALVGFDGVNIHTFKGALYQPFTFSRSGDVWTAQVKPEYYGLLMFTRAAPPGSRPLAVRRPVAPALRTWATRAPNGVIGVVLLNDSAWRPLTLAIRVAGASRPGTLARLRSPRLGATAGVTLAGQTFGRTTTTGVLGGPPKLAELWPVGGRYVVALPPASAALFTLGQ
ncbi:MAG: hypothetical protein JO168_21080 [Solirubrobacterales bacterium]|nr:hypothetical protein [Solirubrobacterales bacterium]